MEQLIKGANNETFIIDLLRNIEDRMSKAKRKRTTNVRIVADYLLLRTSVGGRTSCIEQCNKLGVNPDGYTFY